MSTRKPRNASMWAKPFAVLLGSIASLAAAAEQSYVDYARVLHVDPIIEAVAVPVEAERCDDARRAERADTEFAGEVRTFVTGISIGTAIAEEIRHRERTAAMRGCRRVTRYETQDQIVAYRVHYSYGGDVFVRRMDTHPGERMQVRVNLSTH